MDYIVLDIEFNGRKFASELPMEVIEIGAVRLGPDLQEIDEFSALIKPVYFAKLNSFIKKKTGIPQEAIDEAPGFVKVIGDFQAWLNRSESFLLLTWGGEDLKRIVFDTRMHKLDDAYWMKATYYDLLKGYLRYKNVTNDVSVEGALQDLGIPLEGTAHRALDDAKMTAHVFRAVFSSLDFSLSRHYKDVYSNAKERRYVKNALRDMKAKKLVPSWELFMEKYVKDKLSLEDPRKAAELQEYFAVLTEKVEQKVPDPAKEALAAAAPGAKPEDGNKDTAAPAEGERPEGSNPGNEAQTDIERPKPSPQTTERGEREE